MAERGNTGLARRASVRVAFDGTDITADIRPYFLSMTMTDNEEDLTDDLALTLQDRDGVWLQSWLASAVSAAAADRKISASILYLDGDGMETELPCGEFELDAAEASGPPMVCTLRATSLPYAEPIRQTVQSREWESYDLFGIAMEIASKAGMLVLPPASGRNPQYARAEQFEESDIVFLDRLCKEAGISLKASGGILILGDMESYDAQAPVRVIHHGDGSYVKYRLSTGERDRQYSSCVVRYIDLATGSEYVGSASNPDAKNGQVLNRVAVVGSSGEAEEKAKHFLKQKNKFEMTAQFTFPGDPSLCATQAVELAGFGAWDGKYIIKKAVHSVGSGGYTTQITLRSGGGR